MDNEDSRATTLRKKGNPGGSNEGRAGPPRFVDRNMVTRGEGGRNVQLTQSAPLTIAGTSCSLGRVWGDVVIYRMRDRRLRQKGFYGTNLQEFLTVSPDGVSEVLPHVSTLPHPGSTHR